MAVRPAIKAAIRLARRIELFAPDPVWPTDVTCIKARDGWFYPCIVIELFSPA